MVSTKAAPKCECNDNPKKAVGLALLQVRNNAFFAAAIALSTARNDDSVVTSAKTTEMA